MSLQSFTSPLDLRSLSHRVNRSPLLRINPNIRQDLLFLQNRRRRRRRRPPVVRSGLDHLFQTLISAFPTPNALDLIAPALGFASGTALFLSSRQSTSGGGGDGGDGGDSGEWILCASPTPFNRSVFLRCPSVSFEDGGELLDGVNERLLAEEQHYVNLRPPERGWEPEDGDISYQRVCVRTGDGGVIALDWPDNLDMDKEQGLDTTVMIVPGTAEGSMDPNVRLVVYDALNHGCFPIVMNPRGCAGSPLTTARLFTAADSDDIHTAVQFVNRIRPWATLMSVGLGYGANMLTKYLAEVGETTPLNAAVCIDNPFDLEKFTRSFSHHTALDQKLTSGLIEILRTNKELFQGKTKGFDVAKALSATSIRDFDEAISMVSYGLDGVDDFYSKTSTKQLVNNVKIPALFIQSSGSTSPLFYVPSSNIAENPFTSLLLCSRLPSAIIRSEVSAVVWCQHLAIEWLSAVEFALLKGRHPLLKDLDITVNLSKSLTFVNDTMSEGSIPTGSKINGRYDPAQFFLNDNSGNGNTSVQRTRSSSVNGFLIDPTASVKENVSAVKYKSNLSRPGTELHGVQRDEDVEVKEGKNSEMMQKNEVVISNSAGGDTPDGDRGQVLQTATVVMNMLDVTMPGTLDDEQKKKVLSAMEQGETLMRALQGAVPEDVRGKLTTAAAEILHRPNLNFDGIKKIGWIPHLTPDVKSRVEEKTEVTPTTESENHSPNKSDHRTSDAGNEERNPADDSSGSSNIQESIGSPPDNSEQANLCDESVLEEGDNSSHSNKFQKESSDINGAISLQHEDNKCDGTVDIKSSSDQVVASDFHNNEGKEVDPEDKQNMKISSSKSEEASSSGSSSAEQRVMENEVNDIPKDKDTPDPGLVDQKGHSSINKPEESSPQYSSSNSPSISVTQALDALTGFDNSSQMAVNSVFGVLENMIDQFEKSSSQGNDEEENNIKDQESDNASHNTSPTIEEKTDKTDGENGDDSDNDGNSSNNNRTFIVNKEDSLSYKNVEGSLDDNKVKHSSPSSTENSVCWSEENDKVNNHLDSPNSTMIASLQNIPLGVAMNPYWESPYGTYFRRYLSNQLPTAKSFNSDSTTDLFLDPEEGRWKIMSQVGNTGSNVAESQENFNINWKDQTLHPLSQQDDMDEVIEPSYVILDTEYSGLGHQQEEELDITDYNDTPESVKKEEVIRLIKNSLLDSLKVEVGRRLGMPDLKGLESDVVYDLEHVANAVSRAVLNDNELNDDFFSKRSGTASVKFGTVDGQHIIKIIYYAAQDASNLRKVLPMGVIVGTSLATLRKNFELTVLPGGNQSKETYKPGNVENKLYEQEGDEETKYSIGSKDRHANSNNSFSKNNEEQEADTFSHDGVMVGAVTAALGASALLAHHQHKKTYKQDGMEGQSDSSNGKGFLHIANANIEEEMQEKNQSSLVGSLAEKAMSVAGPVVPTKSDGEVDQERLVAILAELGQKGGILRFVGTFALLWGGVRGALSLTDRLISFFHISERPLFQRIIGFACMVLVLWSPVVIPFLPTLVQCWTTKTSNVIVEYASLIGLYVAVVILIMLWAKRIHGHENPIEHYGLDFTSSPRMQEFVNGLVGGMTIVLTVHSINVVLGYALLSWPSDLPSVSADAIMSIKGYGIMIRRVISGILTALGISIVEELLFRSWLTEEISVDLGYYRAIMISGIMFSLIQRSLPSLPGFLLLSLAFFGIKQRSHDKISATIGVRFGIMTINFIVRTCGLLTYRSATPFWLTGNHLWHPFDGAVGLSVCALLAIFFYPQPPLQKKNISKSPS